ncbi:hypothetical protein [Variovorax sp. WS11]|uniref:hypothetical protein n=1 Tax=Variovorax sp. WS11 TaxID=1105204 RepID=UPI0013DBD71B|nr:hypothetical protein [Variovorax sp. WS11]NDZ17262.1 hypothetical protein [Variovorax sp. WS11]
MAWANDTVTLQGERTIYTVVVGKEAGNVSACSGKLVPADPYKFRALKAWRAHG